MIFIQKLIGAEFYRLRLYLIEVTSGILIWYCGRAYVLTIHHESAWDSFH